MLDLLKDLYDMNYPLLFIVYIYYLIISKLN